MNEFIYPAPSWFVDTGATKCTIPKIINDEIFNFPIKGTDKVEIAGGKDIKLEIISLPKLSLFYILEGEIIYISRENIETWLGNLFIVGMNFLRFLNISMNNDLLTIKIE